MNKMGTPCALLLNDMHISKDNISDFNINWDEALTICKVRGVSRIILGGDLFQSRSSQTLDVLLAVYDAFLNAGKLGILVVLANGNHDKVNQEAIRGYCHVYGEHSNVRVIDGFLTLQHEEWVFDLHIIPYFPENGSFTEKLGVINSSCLSSRKMNYLYLHEGINGALQHASDKEVPASLFLHFDKVFVGHYHNRCVIPHSPVEYIGSSRQHNFGEDEEKGYTLLYTDGKTEFIKNRANIRYQVIDVPVEKVNVHLFDQIEEIKANGNYRIKIKIHSPEAISASIDKSKLIEAGASKVEIITEDLGISEVSSSDLFERFDSHKIIENYKEFCREKDIRDITLGLSYLSKIGNNVETK